MRPLRTTSFRPWLWGIKTHSKRFWAQTLLLQRVLPKPVDALSAALEGVGSEQGSSSSGVRGHTAREAFLRQLEDHRAVASAILENAAAKLGVSAANAHPRLLRELDKKVALSEHKTLGYLATFMVHGWQTARETSSWRPGWGEG